MSSDTEMKEFFIENHENFVIFCLDFFGLLSVIGVIYQAVFYPQFLATLIVVMALYAFWCVFNNCVCVKYSLTEDFISKFNKISSISFGVYVLVLFISGMDCIASYLRGLSNYY